MEIRRELDEEYESFSIEIKPYREMFLGSVHGVLLSQRGINDKHVCFEIIHEDDGHWFYPTHHGGSSSSWFNEIIEVLTEAKKWCEENCEPDIYHGRQYGWNFKD
ncbi:MAG: hypothetical protein ACFFG0_24415 [Candidatus Thorarchaeota archaeon]